MPAQVDGRWGLGDRLMFFGLGVAVALIAWRYASIVAVPSRGGHRRAQPRADPHPHVAGGRRHPVRRRRAVGDLDLEDGDTVAVMAIQKADGPVAGREASRLAALIQAFGEASEPERPLGPS